MVNRIIGVLAMLAAAFMWVMAVATVIRMVGVWPDEVVLHLFMTALCALSGVALWSFGVVHHAKAREAKEAARRERLGLDPVVPDAGTAQGEDDADGAAGMASGAARLASDGAGLAGAGTVDLKDLSFDNIAPEHFAVASESSAEQEGAGAERAEAASDEPSAERGTARVMLRGLPEVREALAETGRMRVKLVRKAMGTGQDPLLVVLLGWTPIGSVKPNSPEYQNLIDFAGTEGEVSADPAAAGGDEIEARLDMRA